MKPFILIITTLFISTAAAAELYKSDLNNDGKVDFQEKFENKILVERLEDLDFNGTFDRQTLFPPEAEEYIKIVNVSAYGIYPKQRITFWNDQKLKRTFSLIQIDKNNDGKWDSESLSSSDQTAHKDNCGDGGPVAEFAVNGMKAGEMSNEYTRTSWGHKIHKSCLDNNKGDWFLKNTEEAMNVGMACLSELAKSGGMGAAKNHASLKNLLAQKNVEIVCNETIYKWGSDTLAHATLSASPEDLKGTSLKHPGISFNSKFFSQHMSGKKEDLLDFKRTLFHEQLHNLGYPHNEDVEYAYTCEKCCFPGEDSKEATEAACRVCSGNYSDMGDIQYLKDMTEFGRLNFDKREALSAARKAMKKNPGNMEIMTLMTSNLSGYFNSIGPELAVRLLKTQKLSPDEAKMLNDTLEFRQDEVHKYYVKTSKVVADAVFESYVSRDPAAALEALKKAAPAINKELDSKNKFKNSKYVVENIDRNIRDLIYDVWLNKNYGKITDKAEQERLNNEAYKLAKIYKFID